METLLAGPPLRQAFVRLGGRTLIAWDGMQYFCSQKLSCPNCLTRERSNGRKENYHCLLSATVVAPGHPKVVPLMPKFVATQDGAPRLSATRRRSAGATRNRHSATAGSRPFRSATARTRYWTTGSASIFAVPRRVVLAS